MTDFTFPQPITDNDPHVSVEIDGDGAQAHANLPFPGRRRAPAAVKLPGTVPPGTGTQPSSDRSSASDNPDSQTDTKDTKDKPQDDTANDDDKGDKNSTTDEDKKDTEPTTGDGEAGTEPATKPEAPTTHKDPFQQAKDHVNDAVKVTPLDPKNLPAVDPSALTSLATLPLTALTSALSTVGPMMSMLGPLIAARQQFGNGDPTKDRSRFPKDSLDGNANSNDRSDWRGRGKEGYRGSNAKRRRKNDAISRLDEGLKKLLDDSGENPRLGREKTDAILEDVNQKLTTLQPIANTAAGQAQVLAIMTQAIQQAGGVVAQGNQQSGVNAGQLNTLAGQYTADMDASKPVSASGGDPNTPSGAIEYALDAHGIKDPAARRRWRHGYEILIGRESGGDRFAVGDNGKAHGFTQTHTGTFNAYHVAGTPADINHGGANVAASMAYVMDRYDVDPSGIDLAQKVQQADPTRAPKGY